MIFPDFLQTRENRDTPKQLLPMAGALSRNRPLKQASSCHTRQADIESQLPGEVGHET